MYKIWVLNLNFTIIIWNDYSFYFPNISEYLKFNVSVKG